MCRACDDGTRLCCDGGEYCCEIPVEYVTPIRHGSSKWVGRGSTSTGHVCTYTWKPYPAHLCFWKECPAKALTPPDDSATVKA